MSDAGAPPPIEPAVACRNCDAPMAPGATVCERCGASSDFVPKAARVDNTGASLAGVLGALVCEIGIAVSSFNDSPSGAAQLVLTIVLPPIVVAIAARIVVGRNPRSSPWRALAYAAGITSLVVLALYVVATAAVFVICSQSHYG